jgi:hypothetical protein
MDPSVGVRDQIARRSELFKAAKTEEVVRFEDAPLLGRGREGAA